MAPFQAGLRAGARWSVQGRCLHSRGELVLSQPLHMTPHGDFAMGILRGRSLQSAAASLWTTGTGLTRSCHQCPHLGRCCDPLRLCLPCATRSRFLPMPRCQPGWFNLQPHNPAGCTSCFCYGHSTACTAADGYEVTHVRSDFSQGTKPPSPGEKQRAQLRQLQPKISSSLGRLGLSIPLWS